jgi:hypothetical protein
MPEVKMTTFEHLTLTLTLMTLTKVIDLWCSDAHISLSMPTKFRIIPIRTCQLQNLSIMDGRTDGRTDARTELNTLIIMIITCLWVAGINLLRA